MSMSQAAEQAESAPEKSAQITFEKAEEQAEEQAQTEIRAYLSAINPYDLQQIVADLLKAMGYYPCWVSPPGADGGLDIVAHPDPLGTRPPRLMQERRKVTLIDPAGAGGGVGPASLLVMSGHQLGASITVSFGRLVQRFI